VAENEHLFAGLLAALLLAPLTPLPAAAQALPSDGICGPFVQMQPELKPVIAGAVPGPASDHAFGCMMWQSFIYLNWPAGAPGEPDVATPFGRSGATVWETYKRHDEVFRADAAAPAPWGVPDLSRGKPRQLRTLHQAGGGTLVDRAGRPVYYEMLINRDEFEYVVTNRLYEAAAQRAFAREHGIALPAGPTEYGPVGAIELKAAWKVLTPAELAARPRRFHTAEALLADGARVTVGLVGMHINQRVAGFTQGVWASFMQVDSAPLTGAASRAQPYSFYDPDCVRCLVNVSTEPPKSTQVEQVFPVAPSVREINAYAQALIRAADPDSPWQFYELLGVQWPQFALGLPTPVPDPRRQLPQGVPLSIGTPSTQTLMNPVLETFHQLPNVSCLGCHANAATAALAGIPPLAADYSFFFGHAQAASTHKDGLPLSRE
jgi:hypothetical protein